MKLILTAAFVFLVIADSGAQSGEGFVVTELTTGAEPACINVSYSRDNNLKNFLKVSVGGDADVVLRLIRNSDHVCIRTLFVSAGESHVLVNIPAGIYYLKIAFGNDWAVSGSAGECTAKFLRNAAYQEGKELLDFTPVVYGNGVQLPSYELRLETYTESRQDVFETESITEEEFFR